MVREGSACEGVALGCGRGMMFAFDQRPRSWDLVLRDVHWEGLRFGSWNEQTSVHS